MTTTLETVLAVRTHQYAHIEAIVIRLSLTSIIEITDDYHKMSS